MTDHHRRRGSAAAETVLVVPLLVLLVVFIVHAGRVSSVRHKVDHAAGAAARAASLVSVERQVSAATAAARADLEESNVVCRELEVRLVRRREAGRDLVRSQVSCTTDRAGLALLGARRVRLTGVSTEVIDVFTYRY